MAEQKLKVNISGEARNAYAVTLIRNGKNLTVSCDCSSSDRLCNHIVSTLFGEKNKIIGGDERTTAKIDEMLSGSDVEHAFRKLRTVSLEAARVKQELAEARSGLGEAIRDFKDFGL